MNPDYIKYLKKLIGFKSVTPASAGAIEYIASLLESNGFNVEIKEFGDNYKVKNLYAKFGSGTPNICFGGHVDVVPAGDATLWTTDPFVVFEKEGKIYGRGAVDMKGAIACMLAAALDFINSTKDFTGQISFLLTSDEEGEAKFGTRAMLEYLHDKDINIDLMIIGEPTCESEVGDIIKIGRRGSINFTLDVLGTQGHVAYPDKADNPLNYMINILQELKSLKLDAGNDFFQSSNLVITSINTVNSATNVIPASARAKFNIRFNDLQTQESLLEAVKQKIEQYTKNYQLTANCSAEVFIQKPEGLIEDFANIVREITKSKGELSTSGGNSDARFAVKYCKVVEFGLLSSSAHKIDEYTEINDLQRLYNVYYYCLSKFLN